MSRCRICNQPIMFVFIVGWVHRALTADGHDAQEKR